MLKYKTQQHTIDVFLQQRGLDKSLAASLAEMRPVVGVHTMFMNT